MLAGHGASEGCEGLRGWCEGGEEEEGGERGVGERERGALL